MLQMQKQELRHNKKIEKRKKKQVLEVNSL